MTQAAQPAEERRQRQRREAKRTILDATEQLLLESGIEAFSMRRLAERCGYTAPSIYHHFGDKKGLVDAVLEERFHELWLRLRRVTHDPDPAIYLRSLARAFIRFGLEHPTHYRLLMSPPLPDAEPTESAERARALMEVPIEDLLAAGRLNVPDVETASQVLWSVSHGVISLQTLRPDREWSSRLPEIALEAVLHGLLIPDPAPPLQKEKER